MQELQKMLLPDWDTSLKVSLRPYQKECLDAIDKGFKRLRTAIVSLPTGAGKTIIFSAYAYNKKWRTLVLAHRDELIQQALEKYVFLTGDKSNIGVIKSGEWNIKPFTAGSVQTLYKNLDKIDGKDFDLVITDEAHHYVASTFRAVVDRLLETNPDLKLLGVTATPFRSDSKNLKDLFEEMVYAIDIKELMRLGYLVPVRGKKIYLPVNMDDLKTAYGDFTDKSISEVFDEDEINRLIVQKWKEEAENRKTIFFLSSVEHAQKLAYLFSKEGIPAQFVEGRMSLKQRQEIIRNFREGKTKILINMNILTEGFDDPSVECIAIVRPTKSLNLYAQIVGRGLRLSPETGKKDCLILDFTGISTKHRIVGLAHLFDIPVTEKEEKEGISIGSVENRETGERKLKVLIGEGTEEFSFEGVDAFEFITRIIFKGREIYLLTCGMNDKTLTMEEGKGGKFDLFMLEKGKKTLIKEGIPKDMAGSVFINAWERLKDGWIEGYIERALKENATEKQKSFIYKLIDKGLLTEYPDLSKLHATNILSFLFALPSKERNKYIADVSLKLVDGGFIDEFTGEFYTLNEIEQLYERGKRINYPHYAIKQYVEDGIDEIPYWLKRKLDMDIYEDDDLI